MGSTLMLVTLSNLFYFVQGNALKDAGRVEEAITCYQVLRYCYVVRRGFVIQSQFLKDRPLVYI